MFNPCKLLLIDGNHLCHRVYWTHKTLSHKGKSVAVLYGFLRSLISLRKKYEDYLTVIAWDGGYERRKIESSKAVEDGLIPAGYKQNRDDIRMSDDFENISSQMSELVQVLTYTKVLQAFREGVEADDIIHSYAVQNSEAGGDTVIITGDKDYYQILKDGVTLYDPLKKKTWTRDVFIEEYGFVPELWVDVGALAGDKSDNIYGIPGWGEKTAIKYVIEYGDVESVFKAISAKNKKSKKEEALMANGERLAVAKSLKKMDMVPYLPKLRFTKEYKKTELEKFLIEYKFITLMKDVWRLVK